MKVLIGTCGFCESMKKYFEDFDTVEIQQTFYDKVNKKRLENWKELSKVNKNFIFNLKAFQGITHSFKSPTWKRCKEIKGKKENYGEFKPTKEVLESWSLTLEEAKILNVRIILIQTPASFKDERLNVEKVKRFFKKIKRDGFEIAIEFRGWNKENIKKICKEFNLIHCVDLFKEKPVWLGKKKIAYLRLHGSYKNGKINYKHDYSKTELKELKEKVEELKAKEIFVLFNNVFMLKNALEFKKLI